MHDALFGGLAVLLRWNLSENRYPLLASVGTAFIVVAVVEVAQGLLALSMNRIVASPIFQESVGLLVASVGLMVGAFFLLADVIGVGDTRQYGPMQKTGMALGALIAMGGVRVYLTLSRVSNRLD